MSITLEELNTFFDYKTTIVVRLMQVQRKARQLGLLKMEYPYVGSFHTMASDGIAGMTVQYVEIDNREDVHSSPWSEEFWVPLDVIVEDHDQALECYLERLKVTREAAEKERNAAREEQSKEWRQTQYDALVADLEHDKEWRRAQFNRFRAEFENE